MQKAIAKKRKLILQKAVGAKTDLSCKTGGSEALRICLLFREGPLRLNLPLPTCRLAAKLLALSDRRLPALNAIGLRGIVVGVSAYVACVLKHLRPVTGTENGEKKIQPGQTCIKELLSVTY